MSVETVRIHLIAVSVLVIVLANWHSLVDVGVHEGARLPCSTCVLEVVYTDCLFTLLLVGLGGD